MYDDDDDEVEKKKKGEEGMDGMALEAAQLILPGRVVVSMLHSHLGKRERGESCSFSLYLFSGESRESSLSCPVLFFYLLSSRKN